MAAYLQQQPNAQSFELGWGMRTSKTRLGILAASVMLGIAGAVGAAGAAAADATSTPVPTSEAEQAATPTSWPSPTASPAGDVGWG